MQNLIRYINLKNKWKKKKARQAWKPFKSLRIYCDKFNEWNDGTIVEIIKNEKNEYKKDILVISHFESDGTLYMTQVSRWETILLPNKCHSMCNVKCYFNNLLFFLFFSF